MSGIAGIAVFDGSDVDAAEVERMLDVIAHRGHDARRIARTDGCVMGHVLFATTPEAIGEIQPRAFGTSLLSADARIDNRAELAGALPLESESDAHFLEAAWRAWGEACVARVVGDFAVAVWDGDHRVLVLARDFLGHRPLYFVRSQGKVAFCSEIQGLLALPWVERDVDGDFLLSWRAGLPDCRDDTMYRSIRRVPAAHVVTVTGPGVERWRYWDANAIPVKRNMTLEDAVAGARSQFEQAVRARMRTHLRLATTLSGGLDSSSVTVMARHLAGPTQVTAYSMVFDAYEDEREFQQAVVLQGGLRWVPVASDGNGPWALLRRMVRARGEPIRFIHASFLFGLHLRAGADGPCVLLDGSEGDNAIWHGSNRRVDLFRRLRWVSLYRLVRRSRLDQGRPMWRRLASTAKAAISPRIVRRHTLAALMGRGPLAHEDLAGGRLPRRGLWRLLRRQRACPPLVLQASSDEALHRSLVNTARVDDLLTALDSFSNAAGIEHRSPFFDRRFVEFCLSVPSVHREGDGLTRFFFRKALEGLLPPEIFNRPGKKNFDAPFYGAIEQGVPAGPPPATSAEAAKWAHHLGLHEEPASPLLKARREVLREALAMREEVGRARG